MPSVPESTCKSCGQRVPVDRDACPYCRTPVDCYWFDDMGETRRAVPFADGGTEYAFINGETLALAQTPAAFQHCIYLARKTPSRLSLLAKVLGKFLSRRSWLIYLLLWAIIFFRDLRDLAKLFH